MQVMNVQVNGMTKEDMNIITNVVSKYGGVEWNLIAFSEDKEWGALSCFSDEKIMPLFRFVLASILYTMNTDMGMSGKDTTHWT